jgi:5'-nucleotidase
MIKKEIVKMNSFLMALIHGLCKVMICVGNKTLYLILCFSNRDNLKMVKYIFFVLCLGEACRLQVIAQDEVRKLVILHTNDLHSRLNGFSPETDYSPFSVNDDQTLGGFARLATLIADEKKKNGEALLVMDDGDFLMGTFFPILEESTGFQLPLMKRMGYDLMTLGNHEFDFGPGVLANIISVSAKNGVIPAITASNMSFNTEDPADDALKALFDNGVINSHLIIEKNGLKVGIFGILGLNAIHDAPLARPVKFENPVKTAKEYARLLKEKEKADVVICLSHSGISKDKNGNWSGEDVTLAQKVPGIDLIISGHTHTLLEEPVIINGIPIVQTGSYGTALGRLELEVRQGRITKFNSWIIPVTDAIQGDPEIQRLISEQEQQITEAILNPVHLSYSTIVAESSFPLVCDQDTLLENSNLGPLITDALYLYMNAHYNPGTDITLFPAGMIRDNLIPGKSGKQSVADLFRVVSLGNGKDGVPGYPLARVYVTGKELKGIMEILYLAPAGNKDNYIYFGGLEATYDPDKGLLKKVTGIKTGDAKKGFSNVDVSKENTRLYSITANTYLLEFVGIIKRLSKGLVKVTLKDETGKPLRTVLDAVIDADPSVPGIQEIKEWIALLWYLQQQPDVNGNGVPDIPDRYRSVGPRFYRE